MVLSRYFFLFLFIVFFPLSLLLSSEFPVHGAVQRLAHEEFGQLCFEFLCGFSQFRLVEFIRRPRMSELVAEVRVVNARLKEDAVEIIAGHYSSSKGEALSPNIFLARLSLPACAMRALP